MFIIISICLEDRNVFTRFDEIPLMTLKDIKETVYTKAIKNYKGKQLQQYWPLALNFLLLVFVLKIGKCLQGLMKFHR